MNEHEPIQNDAQPKDWSSPALFSFRLVFCYLVLYFLYLLDELYFFIIFLPTRKEPPELISRLWHVIIPWFGRHVLRLHIDITIFTNSSADTTYDFVLVLFNLMAAVLATAIWSALDRNRKEYRALYQWLRLGVQFFLSAMVVAYGADKLIPLQFRNLTLSQMVRPVGEMSPITLLWTFMAASPLYTVFAGFAEVLGGVLVLFRRTLTLGALICFAAMCNVLALNLSYDVPVKLQTFQFSLLAFFLLIPDFQRLANFFLFNRPAEPRRDVPLSDRAQIDRLARHAVSVSGVLVLCWFLFFGYRLYKQRQALLSERGPLYGVWDVDQFTVGATKPGPLFTARLQKMMRIQPGHEMWQRLLFDSGNNLIIQLEGPNMDYVKPVLDEKSNSLTITDEADPNWMCKLNFQRPEPASLLLKGDVNGAPVVMKLHRENDARFALTSRGFHLISEHAFFN